MSGIIIPSDLVWEAMFDLSSIISMVDGADLDDSCGNAYGIIDEVLAVLRTTHNHLSEIQERSEQDSADLLNDPGVWPFDDDDESQPSGGTG